MTTHDVKLSDSLEREMIAVYRESPAWDTAERWFQVPRDMLRALYVATYQITGNYIRAADMERHATAIRAKHPNCVLVYADVVRS